MGYLRQYPILPLLTCAGCGTPLAEMAGAISIVRLRGRDWHGQVYAIRCETCGATWRAPDAPDLDPAGHVPGGAPVLCETPGCGNRIAVRGPDYVQVRHAGRAWVGQLLSLRCEDCGGLWQCDERRDAAALGRAGVHR